MFYLIKRILDSDLSWLLADIYLLPVTPEAVVSLFAAFVLLLISGFISTSEAAYVSLKASDLKPIEENDDSYKKVHALLKDSERLSASLMIFRYFFNVAAIVLAAYGVGRLVDYANAPWHFPVLFFFSLCFVLLFFCRILPEIIAQRFPLKLAKSSAGFLRLLTILGKPFSSGVMALLRSSDHYKHKRRHDISVDELSKALELSSDEIKEEKEILEGILQFYDKTVVQIMTSKIDVFALDIRTSFKTVIKDIVHAGYSRIPVYANSLDTVKGILYIKDLLPYIDKPDSFRWQSLIRPAFFVPETKKIDDLLEEFRTNKTHLAIVVNEFGELSGVISLEDVLEEIVGEINDEYDDDDARFQKLSDGSYLFEAKTPLTDFFKITGLNPDDFDQFTSDVETLAGLILEIKGSFPELEEVVEFQRYSFQVLEISQRRILKVKLLIKNNVPETVQ